MDHYDDIQIEDFSSFDFVEEVYEELFDENEDDKSFQRLINTNYDF